MSTFRFRKKTDYGLIMVSLLAHKGKGEVMSVHEMQDMGLPRSFLVKIAKDLVDNGIIGAKEGRGGGYFLKADPKSTTLKKVVEVLEGKVTTALCVVHGYKCPLADKCPHRGMMKTLTEELSNVLDKYTIATLADN
jgi:Rrf2 family protein